MKPYTKYVLKTMLLALGDALAILTLVGVVLAVIYALCHVQAWY